MNILPAMKSWYEQNVAASPVQPEAPKLLRAKSEKPPKTKKPVNYSGITEIDRRAMDCLQKCTLPPGTSGKRFVRQFGRLTRLSDGGRRFLWFLAHRFRRQIQDREVVREAHRRREASNAGGGK